MTGDRNQSHRGVDRDQMLQLSQVAILGFNKPIFEVSEYFGQFTVQLSVRDLGDLELDNSSLESTSSPVSLRAANEFAARSAKRLMDM
ncbi:hypothetical protein OGATHE_005385 [Ogataea polymorpha]|uniref:Uncharacterized protein n=1 Tax=Ogataea polymorpha TaxID=460523 RepID=A0A9P8SZT9_9ASCO|nr:hypothetical protein OGATHE_005385 [Ogataea polymorpha]